MVAGFPIRAVACLTAFFISAILFPEIVSAQDCTPADITLNSQADVDSFQANHGPCDTVTGELKIEGDDISSLAGLSELTEVWHLNIWNNPQLGSLEGLDAVTYASWLHIANNPSLTNLQGVTANGLGTLLVTGNEALVNLQGLEALEHVGYLIINYNSSLKNLEGLSGLTRVNANLFQISGNGSLESLDGLESLQVVRGDLIIEDNNALTNIDGLASLTDVGTDMSSTIKIQRNAALLNLDGLSSLTDLHSAIIIHLNDSLADISGLSRLTDIGAMLHIAANPSLADLDGLEALTAVGSVGITNNATLKDLRGLSNLETVRTWFEISWNPMLTNLDGLSSLSTVGASGTMNALIVQHNEALNNLDGISALEAVGSLAIEHNPTLADCQGMVTLVDPIDDFEPGPGPGFSGIPDIRDRARIQNNLRGCNSVNEILAKVPLIEINAGLNDAWFNLETDGQGFFVTVFPDIQMMFLAWFTYDTERPDEAIEATLGDPGHRWLTAFGPYADNEAILDIEITEGGVFDSPDPMPTQHLDGTITIEFPTCNAGTVTYDIPSIERQGVVPIERIALDNISLCYLLDSQAETDAQTAGKL
jgi:hypothetical protein